MASTKQFHVSAERRTFFDRKVLHYGYSRTLSMGKIIPREWEYVRIRIKAETPRVLEISIERLRGAKDDARVTKNDKADRHDT